MRSTGCAPSPRKVSVAVLGNGGKTLDTAKSAGAFYERPGRYRADHAFYRRTVQRASGYLYRMPVKFDRYLLLPHNPNMVIVTIRR